MSVQFKNKNFEAWMKLVNQELDQVCGLESEDLPDCDYIVMWDSDYTPKQAAVEVLEYAEYY